GAKRLCQLTPKRGAANGGDADFPGPACEVIAAPERKHNEIADRQLANVLTQLDVFNASLEPHRLNVFDFQAIAHVWSLLSLRSWCVALSHRRVKDPFPRRLAWPSIGPRRCRAAADVRTSHGCLATGLHADIRLGMVGITVHSRDGPTSCSAHMMSARSEDWFWGDGRHQGWRATRLFYVTCGSVPTRYPRERVIGLSSASNERIGGR